MQLAKHSTGGIRAFCLIAMALSGFTLHHPLPLSVTAHAAEPQNAPASFDQIASQAQAAMAANQTDQAIRLYERAVAMRPAWSEGWWYLGTLFFDSGQIPKAHDAFLQFVSVERKQPGPGFGMLGLVEFQRKEYANALAAFERGIQLGLGDNAQFVHAVLYHDAVVNNLLGRSEIALVRLTLVANQLALEHPAASKEAVLEDAPLLNAFGLTALRISKLPDEIPSDKSSLIREAGHAQALIAEQDRAGAGAELKQLIEHYPTEPGVHYFYGVYLLKEDPPSAVPQFEQEIRISPKHTAAHIQLALEFLRSNDYKQGLKHAQTAIELEPRNFVAHIACGKLLLGLEENARAVEELRTAVKLAPDSPDAHFALSRALSALGQSQEAAQERAEFEKLKALSDANNKR